MLGCARTHVVVPKPVEYELLVWCLAANMLPTSDKPQIVGSLDEWLGGSELPPGGLEHIFA